MKSRPAVVGGFVLGGLLLAVGAILFFGGVRLFTPTLRAVIFFPSSVAGLSVGSPVTFRGVQVGTVQKIALLLNVADRSSIIPVYVQLDSDKISFEDPVNQKTSPGIPRLVEAGLRATLSTPSLVTGQLGIELDFRPDIAVSAAGPAVGLPEIPTMTSALQNLKDKLTDLPLKELVDDVRSALASLQEVANSLSTKIDPLTESARQTADAARETLKATTESIRAVSADASRTLGDIDKLAVDGRQTIVVTGKQLQSVLASAQRTAHNAERLTASLNTMVEPRSELRGDLEASLRDLAASASSLRTFSRELERSPISALKGR
jgi:paraquat-inducible protein B